jgi:hypothetical protein
MLPVVVKIFEKFVSYQLCVYLETNGLLANQQYGFRQKHLNQTSLLNATNKWYLNMDKGYPNAVVFLDQFNKAFDCVDQSILYIYLTN